MTVDEIIAALESARDKIKSKATLNLTTYERAVAFAAINTFLQGMGDTGYRISKRKGREHEN